MGWLQYRLGNYEDAAKYLRRALEVNPDSEIAAHLTEVLWVMGDKQAARTIWKQALAAAPGNKFLLEEMDKLDHKLFGLFFFCLFRLVLLWVCGLWVCFF